MAMHNATIELGNNGSVWQKPEYSWAASPLSVNNSFSQTAAAKREEKKKKTQFQAAGSLSNVSWRKKKVLFLKAKFISKGERDEEEQQGKFEDVNSFLRFTTRLSASLYLSECTGIKKKKSGVFVEKVIRKRSYISSKYQLTTEYYKIKVYLQLGLLKKMQIKHFVLREEGP